MPDNLERRLAAIMSVDVVGYSRLMGMDEAGTLRRLTLLRQDFLEPLFARHRGRVVKLIGDGILLEFHSCVDAVECGLAIQKEMPEQVAAAPEDQRITLRIGVNLGEVIIQDDDIFGDGVNIAARIESVAEPGGVALSGSAWKQVEGKIVAVFEDCGEMDLKNISRPVSVYRWPNDTQVPGRKVVQAGTGLQLPNKPAIMVLPFENRSSDPEQEYFVDGITEDIITELSRYSSLFIISRHSSFEYKTRHASVQDIRRELGVRYVIQGSARRMGSRIRVNVELTDCETSRSLWVGRFDREVEDIFDVEEELTQAIVAALPGQIFTAEVERVKRNPPQVMGAYDYMVAGRLLHHRLNSKDNATAVDMLNKAIELDPDYAEAHAWKACTLGQAVVFGFLEDKEKGFEEALASLDRAVALNDSDVECNRLMCEVCMETSKLDQAIAHNERALSQTPNDPRLVAQRGELLTFQGRAEEAVQWVEKAMQLDPYGAPRRAHLLARAQYAAGRYDDAIKTYGRLISPMYPTMAEGAAAHARNGDMVCASRIAGEVLKARPDFSVSAYIEARPFLDRNDKEHFSEGMILAGLPE